MNEQSPNAQSLQGKSSQGSTAVTITTGARLHFGLFDVRAPFGGIGMMIDHPRTTVTASHADEFEIAPVSVERVYSLAQRLARFLPATHVNNGLPRAKVTINAVADSHCGLGSGTQLALATSQSLAQLFSITCSRHELVQDIASRGRRSSIGSIGFFEGGLIIEDGAVQEYEGDDTWRRVLLPDSWRVVIACPPQDASLICGDAEGAAFASLAGASASERESLKRLGEKIVSSGEAGQFEAFSVAVTQFNQQSGDLFSEQQGGCYNGPLVAKLAERMKQAGVRGYGQSSWGPTVFGFCEDDESADAVRNQLADYDCRIVSPQRRGYVVERSPSTSCK